MPSSLAVFRCSVALAASSLAGCLSAPGLQENPTVVAAPPGGYEQVWNTTVFVVGKYFDVASENRYDGRIETFPQTGATLVEPWRPDAADFYERLEGSLQTIRRRGFVQLQPAPDGGFTVTVEVYKELEDLAKPLFTNFAGGSLVHGIQPIQEQVLDQAVPPGLGWISMGRDAKLEARILANLKAELLSADVSATINLPFQR